MESYYNLEKAVLSCLLDEPKLMEGLEIDDKYFIKYKRLWTFMKAFYKKFQNFDTELMSTVCTNKEMMIHYVVSVKCSGACYVSFEKYIKRLKEMYEEKKEEQAIIEMIYKLSTDLFVRNIKLDEFKEKLNLILK